MYKEWEWGEERKQDGIEKELDQKNKKKYELGLLCKRYTDTEQNTNK